MIVAIKRCLVKVLFASWMMGKLSQKWNVLKTVQPRCIFVIATDTGISRFWKERPTKVFFWFHGTPRSGDSYSLQFNEA